MAHKFRNLIIFAAALSPMALAHAQTVTLKGEEIKKLLGNHVLANQEEQVIQAFSSNGRTIYKSKDKQLQGAWRVVDNFYCSAWGADTGFKCYMVSVTGKTVSFIAQDGSSNQWTLVK